MMTIVQVTNFLNNGGPSKVIQNLTLGLKNKDCRQIVVTLIDKNDVRVTEKLRENGVEIISLGYKKSLKEVFRHRKEIREQIQRLLPDIVHVHGIVGTILTCNMNLVKVATLHNNIFEDYEYTYGKRGRLFAVLHLCALRKFNAVACCSEDAKEAIARFLPEARVVYNGIDLEDQISREKRKSIRSRLKIKENDKLFVYAGVLNSRKRVVELAELFKKSSRPNEYLLFIGGGEKIDILKTMAREGNIIVVGHKEDALDYIAAADFYVSNSASEGFSISILEALHLGTPLFLSDIPSHKECFKLSEGVYIGGLFTAENFLVQKRSLALSVDHVKIRNFARKCLSRERMALAYKDIYEELR